DGRHLDDRRSPPRALHRCRQGERVALKPSPGQIHSDGQAFQSVPVSSAAAPRSAGGDPGSRGVWGRVAPTFRRFLRLFAATTDFTEIRPVAILWSGRGSLSRYPLRSLGLVSRADRDSYVPTGST